MAGRVWQRRRGTTPPRGVPPTRPVRAATALAVAAALAVIPALAAVGAGTPGASSSVVVRGAPGAAGDVVRAVERLGGDVTRELGLLDGVAAEVPSEHLGALERSPGVLAVTPDAPVQLAGGAPPATKRKAGLPDFGDPNTVGTFPSLQGTTTSIGASNLWARGVTGRGVGVALIDSGVVPVQGLNGAGKVVNGPDLSFDSQFPELRHLDGFGHGTHMAGIIAGSDVAIGQTPSPTGFTGVAPGAHIVNVKVGASDGLVDVSQVIAGIDWVVEHRNDPGLNIRVLNLSFGTNSLQDARLDPLSYAAEVAWSKGLVVVVAGGNEGRVFPRLTMPAANPFVLAVGAADLQGTDRVDDDTVPAFSSRGRTDRRVDVVAPGAGIVSLRTPGSLADTQFPGARVGTRFFRGSGTSQAAAVVSGAAALLLERRPTLTPDQVKRLLTSTARPLPMADAEGRGAGAVNVTTADSTATPPSGQPFTRGSGLGTLEGARGGVYVADAGVALTGERDIFGRAWSSKVWAPAAANETAWNGGDYLGFGYSGADWSGSSFAARTWSARTWSARTWSARTWSSTQWSARTWSGSTWVARTWSSAGWVTR